MIEMPTAAELLGAVIILIGLGLSLWALIDDAWDLAHVYHFGEVGGPRWVAASEHTISDLTFLGAWTCLLGVISIAIYLPARTDQPADTLAMAAGWLRFGATICFLMAQVNRRVGRMKMRALPLESWERMLAAMFDGLTVEQRANLTARLLQATTAGREIGHLIANDLQAPVALLDELARDQTVDAERRAEALVAVAKLDSVMARVRTLHALIKSQEGSA